MQLKSLFESLQGFGLCGALACDVQIKALSHEQITFRPY